MLGKAAELQGLLHQSKQMNHRNPTRHQVKRLLGGPDLYPLLSRSFTTFTS